MRVVKKLTKAMSKSTSRSISTSKVNNSTTYEDWKSDRKKSSQPEKKTCNCLCILCECDRNLEYKIKSYAAPKPVEKKPGPVNKDNIVISKKEKNGINDNKNNFLASEKNGVNDNNVNVSKKIQNENTTIANNDEFIKKIIKEKNQGTFERISDYNNDGYLNKTVIEENSQTNSGVIGKGAQFLDGGMGDVGLQWKKVKLRNSKIIINHFSLGFTEEEQAAIQNTLKQTKQ